MPNDRLRDAMFRSGLSAGDIARHVGVEPTTAERWFTEDSEPHRQHRTALASLVREPEEYLWPDATPPDQANQTALAGVARLYPRLALLPDEVCWHLLDQARRRISLLADAGLFRPEHHSRLVGTLVAKAGAGVRVEILFSDPTGPAGTPGSADDGTGAVLAARLRTALAAHERLRDVPGAAVHLHRTTLYNSIYRFDDEMLVNPRIFGFPADHTPVVHLRAAPGDGLFRTYADSFDRVWATSVPAWPPTSG